MGFADREMGSVGGSKNRANFFLKVTFSLGAIAEFNAAAKMQSPQPEGLTPPAGFRWRSFLVFLLLIAPFDSYSNPK
ncbi:hypothetical protein QUA56_17405 [Microcoleus sp. N3A4]|uniref:hypothetical protein n=1 Tax=Microcoleus sp. N3A4 TaxID=3055379 RepID=UPI002FD67A0C